MSFRENASKIINRIGSITLWVSGVDCLPKDKIIAMQGGEHVASGLDTMYLFRHGPPCRSRQVTVFFKPRPDETIRQRCYREIVMKGSTDPVKVFLRR